MAKEKLELDASPAVQAIARLTETITSFNTQAMKLEAETRKIATMTNRAKRTFEAFKSNLSETNTNMRNLRDGTHSLNIETRNLVSATGRASGFLQTTADITKVYNNEMRTSVRVAASFTAAFSKTNQTLQKEAKTIASSQTLMKSFNTQLRQVINTMKLKNDTVAAQEKKMLADAAATKQASGAMATLGGSIGSVTKIITALALHRLIIMTAQSVTGAVSSFREYERELTKINTLIKNDMQPTVRQWRTEVDALTISLGVDPLTTAQAAYFTLSNRIKDATGQIGGMGDTLRFLNAQTVLSAAAVTDMNTAVGASTSIINAFGWSQEEATRVGNVLFLTMQEGRMRLEEMEGTLGRVSILSSQLGVSFEEQQAALAVLTRQGVNTAEAMTYLRNVLMRLNRPSDVMKATFESWGVTSGAAALQMFGLAGTLSRIQQAAEANGDVMAELGDQYGRIRALIGAMGLGALEDEMREVTDLMRNDTLAQFEAFDDQLGSIDNRIERQTQRFRVYRQEAMDGIIEGAVIMAESFGGVDKMLNRLGSTLFGLIGAYTAARTAGAAYNVMTIAQTSNVGVLTASLRAMGITATVASAKTAAATMGLSLAVGALAYAFARSYAQAENFKVAIRDAGIESTKLLTRAKALEAANIDKIFEKMQEQARGLGRDGTIAIAALNRQMQALAVDSRAATTAIDNALKAFSSNAMQQASKGIQTLKQQIQGLTSGQQSGGLQIFNLDEEAKMRRFMQTLMGQGTQKQLTALNRGIASLRGRYDQLFAAGDTEKAATLLQNIGTLQAEIERLAAEEGKNKQSNVNVSQVLLDLEKQRNSVIQQRLRLETQAQANRDAEKKAAEAELKAKEAGFEALKKTLTELDKLGEGDTAGFKKIQQQLFAGGPGKDMFAAAGVDKNAALEVFRELNKRIAVETRREEDERNREAILNVQKGQREITETLNRELQKRKELIKNFNEEVAQIATPSAAQLKEIQKQVANDPFFREGVGLRTNAAERRRRNQMFSGANEAFADLEKNRNPESVENAINNLEILKTRIREIGGKKSAQGIPFIEEMIEKLRELDNPQGPLAQHVGQWKDLDAQMKAARAELDQLPEKYRTMIQAGDMEEPIKDFKSLKEATSEWGTELREAIKLLQQTEGRRGGQGTGQKPPGMAFGGMGIDRKPHMLAHGEMVLSQLASRQMRPFMEVANRLPAMLRPNQGQPQSSVTFGDINITTARGTSDQQVIEIANKLQRLGRRGIV